MGPNETEKLLHSKGNYKKGEKTTLRLGENNSRGDFKTKNISKDKERHFIIIRLLIYQENSNS